MQILCALLLCLNLFTPQNPAPVKVKCVLVNLAPYTIVCGDKDKREFEMESSAWPRVWHGAHLTGTYNAEFEDGKLIPLETFQDSRRNEFIRANTLKEMRRWRIPPTQTSGRPE